AGAALLLALTGRLEARFDGSLPRAIADADKLEDRPGTRVSQARLGQPQDARVSAGPIDESGRDLGKQHANGLLIAQQAQRAAARGDDRGDGLVPFAVLGAFAPGLPGVGVARRGGAVLFRLLLSGQRLAGDRDATLDQRANLLGLFDGRDDAALDLR